MIRSDLKHDLKEHVGEVDENSSRMFLKSNVRKKQLMIEKKNQKGFVTQKFEAINIDNHSVAKRAR